MFDPADVAAARPPHRGAPVKGTQGEEAWAQAAESCAGEIKSLPTQARRQFIERLGREMELVSGQGPGGFGQRTVAQGVRRLRNTSTGLEDGLAFNLQVVKAHVMRDLLGVSHASVAQYLQVSTSSLYGLLAAWTRMLATGELPVQQIGTGPGPVDPVEVDQTVLEEITKLPAKSQGSAFLRAAREIDPAAVRTTGRRSPTLSSQEVAYINHKEQTVAPGVMADPGGSGGASPVELAIGRAYSGDDDYDDRDDDWDEDEAGAYEDEYEAEEALALALDADDAGLEEYDALRSGSQWPTPDPDPCVCTQQVFLRGSPADVYVEDHLTFTSREEDEAGLYVCPTTGRRWHQDWPSAGPSSWGNTRLRQLR
jgi:hypothetical protein